MARLPLRTWIGNAWAVLGGRHGAVTQQAHDAGCSRQIAYQHAAQVQHLLEEAQATAPSRAELLRDNERLREENRQLWQGLESTVDLPKAKQQAFAAQAAADGISLGSIQRLLHLLLGAAAPSRATVGRWVQQAGRQAGRLLDVLDTLCHPRVHTACLDEIFSHRTPILVGVEPASLLCLLAHKAARRDAATWAAAVQPWDHVQRVVADGANGLQQGVALAAARRAPPGGVPATVVCARDLFHGCRDAGRVLRHIWQAAERVWQAWDKQQATFTRLQYQGVPWQTPAYRRAQRQLGRAPQRAAQVLAEAEAQEAAWRQARAAFEVFQPDGTLTDLAWAQTQIVAALPRLAGARWTAVRNFLTDPQALSFLEQLHQDLAGVEPREEVRAALVRCWWRRRQRRSDDAATRTAAAVQQVVCAKLAPDWAVAYRRVARVLARVVRASSVVECLNSVWRMHQARHRTLTQGLLDLKRLYWNGRAFATGKRKRSCPYQLVGVELPSYDPWTLLQMDPQQLAQQVSTPPLAA